MMPNLRQMLGRGDETSTVIRAYLRGMTAALAEVVPGDEAGRRELAELRREIEALLGPPTPPPLAPPPPSEPYPLRRAGALPAADGPGPWLDVPSLDGYGRLAPGLRLMPGAPVDPAIATALRLRPGDLGIDHRLAVAATQLLHLAPRDPDLVDFLPPGTTRRPADPAGLAALRLVLLQRLEAYATAADDRTRIGALVLVDEVLCSVRHNPPAEAGSWWATWYDRIRWDTIEAGRPVPGVDLTVLSGRYENIGGQSRQDALATGPDGEILACLRLWVRVGDAVQLGRVLVGAR